MKIPVVTSRLRRLASRLRIGSAALENLLRTLRPAFSNMPNYVYDEIIPGLISDPYFVQLITSYLHDHDGDITKQIRNFCTEHAAKYGDKNLGGSLLRLLDCTWKLKVLTLSISKFSKVTASRILSRQFGDVVESYTPDDAERTKRQRDVVKGDGNNEPVILKSTPVGYEIIEGWHRVMSLLLLGKLEDKSPSEWKAIPIKAWVGFEHA